MAKESLGIAGIGLTGLGAAGILLPGAPAWMPAAAVAGGVAACVYGYWEDHYTDLDKLFLNCNLYVRTINDTIILPKKIKTIRKNNGKDIILSLPEGLCLDDFRLKDKHISQALDAFVSFEYNNGIIIMSVKENKLSKSYNFTQMHTEGTLELILGYCHDGLLTLDLSSAPSPHLGVFGETNGGKSVILRGIITQLILDKTPNELELYLIDPKQVEFVHFEKSAFVKRVAYTDDEILNTLIFLAAETDRRYTMLRKAEAENIKVYNKKAKEKLKYTLCIIDEFADLAEDKEMNNMVNYIARKARAVGIHLIVACQRPDKDVLDGKIKANIGNILGLKTTTQVNSRVIIDKEGLENLRGFGRGLLKTGNKYIEMQSMYIETATVKKLIKHTFEKKVIETPAKTRGWVDGSEE